METEVLPTLGELRVQDLRGVVDDEISVFVLGRPGEASFAGVLGLVWVPAGRARFHRMLVCPKCQKATRTLRTDGSGGIGCSGCSPRLTAHQRYRDHFEFEKMGGRAEDQLLRLLRRPGRTTEGGRHLARRLVHELLAGDRDRVAALDSRIHAALEVQ